MKVLMVEDDAKIAELVCQGLTESGFDVEVSSDGDSGLKTALRKSFDLFIVDLMLPGTNGLDLVSSLRKEKIRTPVLILSAKRSVDDRVLGLQKGGDDYLTKPFAFAELLARCQALVRRYSSDNSNQILSYGDITLNLISREAHRGGQRIDLQSKEFSLLEYFLRQPEIVLSKAQILEHVWNYSFDPQTNVVDVLVCRLRNKLDKDFDTKSIQTIRGVGYVLKED